MKQMSLEKTREKSSIAWFKLAEVITRGEKERALSIYRLLKHSIPHDAITAQLEGDILRVFDDPAAVQAYMRAADFYQKNNEEMQAFLVYEWIVSLCVAQHEAHKACVGINNSCLTPSHKRVRYEQLLVGMLMAEKSFDEAFVQRCIIAVLTECRNEGDGTGDMACSRFLAKLAALDEKAYAYAREQLLTA